MQADKDEQHVEQILVKVDRLFRRVSANQVSERALHQAVLVAGDQPEPDLQRNEADQRDDAKRSERVMADAPPRPAKIAEHRARTSDEAGEARRRASD